MANFSELVEKFDRNLKQYKSISYDEANVRVDFIDKFFEALGWDVRNEKGYSEDYRDVVREDKVVIQGKPKAPDYSFRIGGVRKFFVEAKKPSVDIRHAQSPAFQIRRYAYTAKLPLSILTDFEEFAVYDTRIKPDQKDDASVGRIFYCKYTDYQKEWESLKNTYSKDAILKGSFDAYISDKKRQKGTSEVDKEFLKTIDEWRVELAKTIAKNNQDRTTYDINYAVQKLIDRIIFLRFAEDHNIEEYGSLKKFLETREDVYPQLDEFFKKADVKYNSSLFKPEKYISDLTIADKTLHTIIRGLYYPKCPYEFSVLPIEILGSIYEKFLGKTIRLTASHQAKVEEKPEVRKAGGVYYTPQYIVDYIVENTVGEKLKGRKPEDFAKKTGGTVNKLNGVQVSLKILDPACGSGSFLVRAYDYLLKWHLEQYTKNKLSTNLKRGVIYQVGDDTYRLSIRTKQEVLTNHIHGVDIDRQAVEVTKLSLLLKLMEGESEQTSAGFLRYDQARLLPDLSQNIKCGNSLIGSDFYDGQNLSLFGTDEKLKINVFDWDGKDGFPEIMKGKKVVKDWKTYHITWVTYGSRVSEQMVKYGTVLENPVTLSLKSRQIIVDALAKKIKQTKYRVLSCSVLSNHVHCILVCTENDISDVVHDLKRYSSHAHNRQLKLSVVGEGRQTQLWAKGSHKRELKTQEHTKNAIDYVWNNHHKHGIDAIDDRQLKQFVVNYDTAYAPIEEQGGFDCVIGNPPWVSLKGKFGNDLLSESEINYLIGRYKSNSYMPNLYENFVFQGLNILAKDALFSFIVPDRLGFNLQFIHLRKKILLNFKIVNLSYKAKFPNVIADTLIFVIKNTKAQDNDEINVGEFSGEKQKILKATYLGDKFHSFTYSVDSKFDKIIKNIDSRDVVPVSEIFESTSGFGGRSKEITPNMVSNDQIKILRGRDVEKYYVNGKYYFNFKRENITGRTTDKKKLGTPEKILLRKTGYPIYASYDATKIFPEQSLYFLFNKKSKTHYFFYLGIINSRVFNFYYWNNLVTNRDSTPQLKKVDLDRFPFVNIVLTNPAQKSQHDQMVSLVDQMLATQKHLHETTSPIEKKQYQQEADILDKQIDQLVYELYELTPEEIKIVEGEGW